VSSALLLHDSVRRGAKLYPSRVAVTDGHVELTYAALYDRAARLAGGLRAAGLAAGGRFGLLARNRVEMAELFVAAAASGCTCVPLNFRLAAPEVAAILADAEAGLVLVEPELEHLLDASDVRRLRFGREYDALLAAPFVTRPKASEIVLQMYTSGTTGTPKGAMLSHRNLVANSWTNLAERNVIEGDVYLVVTPLCQIGGVSRLMTALHCGAAVHLRPRFEPEEALQLVEDGRVTTAFLVATMLRSLLEAAGTRALETKTFRRLCYGGSPTPLDLLGDAMERMRCEFQQGYGLTESSPNLTTLRPEDHRWEGPARARLSSVGRESLGVEVRVVDESGNDVAAGERGEIVARGANIMEGYWKRPEATAAAIRDGWLHTGDIGVLDSESYLFLVDRTDDMLISGGINVYPREIELFLEAQAGVAEVAVVGKQDERWGEVALAFVVAGPNADPEQLRTDLVDACAVGLAGYKRPREYVFVKELPRNALGKVLKHQLRQQARIQAVGDKAPAIPRQRKQPT
jgi:acyl-CoA synthetase (AMP-forming)/AMP-acid ligase II